MSHKLNFDQTNNKLILSGDWTLPFAAILEQEVALLDTGKSAKLLIDGHRLHRLDSAGALLLQNVMQSLHAKKVQVRLLGFNQEQLALLDLLEKQRGTRSPEVVENFGVLYAIGKQGVEKYQEAKDFLTFIGELFILFIRALLQRRQIQWRALFNNVEEAGFHALPILALLSFLIGLVLAYQMGLQLELYGANIYIVNLLGLSLLREFAPLMTAVIVAGRTSSAYTAQIGTMKVNEEIDALRTMGLSPFRRLVIPKFFACLIILPLLTLWADFFSVLGGMVMSKNMLDIHYYDFITRFEDVIDLESYMIGLGKAPIFAAIISAVGCFQGFQVAGSAESVGKHTTKSVVQAIFLIIIADAIFSILFSWQGI